MKHSLLVLLAAAFSLTPISVKASTTIDELSALSQVGAGQLAVKLLEQYRPPADQDVKGWQVWQRRQIEVSRGLGNWNEALELLAVIPSNVDPEYRYWAISRRAEGLMATGQPAEARTLLRNAIWTNAKAQGAPQVVLRQQQADWLPTWRRQLIKAYLEEARYDEAQLSASLYVTDYERSNERTQLRPGIQRFPRDYVSRSLGALGRLQARVALYDKRYRDAWRLLERDGYPEAQLARGVSQLREQFERRTATKESQEAAARTVLKNAFDIADDKQHAPDWRKSAAILAHEASIALVRPIAASDAILKAVSLAPIDLHGESLLRVEDTWYLDALARAGNMMLNGSQLRDAPSDEKFSAINQWKRGPALAGLLAIATNGGNDANDAFRLFSKQLLAEKKGGVILKRLLLDSGSFSNLASLPLDVRYDLVEYLLNTQQIADASRLMDSLAEPPAGTSLLNWQMRRARVLILAGKKDAGHAAMQQILDQNPSLDVRQGDRLMQVIFDFQAAGEHTSAINFLNQVAKRDLDDQRRRELHFWLADSYKGKDLHLEGAHHYLLSAGHLDPFSMDQWAQTARFEAAIQLQEAGLREDAARIFQRLKNVSDDPGRKAMLQTRIDRLGGA